ncbi:MAG: DUF6305 family protein [bacterium]|nr:DUF6305 family protein [bacterium]
MKTLVMVLSLLFAWAAVAEERPFAEPILLTSCGQSADVLMMKTLLARDSLSFEFLPSATAENLPNMGSLLIVLGGSSKGLGAAKISEADEIARVTALTAAAEAAGIPILAAHIGGLNRRGPLSDPFNRLGAEQSSRLVVVKGGDDDGFFAKIAAEKSIPLDTLNTALDVAPLLAEIYHEYPSAEAEKQE